jgi:hypothetical protein
MSSIRPQTAYGNAVRPHLFLKDTVEIQAAANPNPRGEYDGMTVRFRLHAFVAPGVHKIKIAIADRDKPFFYSWRSKMDSGVFIRQDSIRTIQPSQ